MRARTYCDTPPRIITDRGEKNESFNHENENQSFQLFINITLLKFGAKKMNSRSPRLILPHSRCRWLTSMWWPSSADSAAAEAGLPPFEPFDGPGWSLLTRLQSEAEVETPLFPELELSERKNGKISFWSKASIVIWLAN